MAGSGLYDNADPYGGVAKLTASSPSSGGQSHMAFLVWVVLLGVVLPVAILGGLKVGGFSFVFKGR